MATTVNPYATDPDDWGQVIDKMCQAGPIHRIAVQNGVEGWLVTGHAEVQALMTDPRISCFTTDIMPFGRELADDVRRGLQDGLLLALNGNDHARVRRLTVQPFTARRTEGFRAEIERIADELLDELAEREEFDVVDDFAFPLPIRVIGELLGVPKSDIAPLREWVCHYIEAPLAPVYPAAEMTEFVRYLRELVELKRAEPDGGFISALIAARDGVDGSLSEHELTSVIAVLIVGGYESTAHTLASSIGWLVTHADEAARLRQQPELVASAVDEFLRYFSTVTGTFFRLATEPIQVGDAVISPGEPILFSLYAANHDLAVFENAADVVLSREPSNQNVAFGFGAHYCAGAALARAELQVAIPALLRRFPNLHLAVPEEMLKWHIHGVVRGLPQLLVATR